MILGISLLEPIEARPCRLQLLGSRLTGCGIAPDLQAKIFEPFVTHGKAQGTGLGMAIAKNVIEAHGGFVALQSTVGVGTTVEIVLPTLASV